MAFTKMDCGEYAWGLADMINPIKHSDSEAHAANFEETDFGNHPLMSIPLCPTSFWRL